MPKTIIKIKTWSCPNCNYHQDFEPTNELMLKHFKYSKNVCPSCGKEALVKETDDNKKVKLTIIGDEDIENEIKGKDDEKEKENKAKMTNNEKEAFRTQRRKDITDAISKARLLENK
jgi:uncharacterized Zn finger protein (UPF0148 family)